MWASTRTVSATVRAGFRLRPSRRTWSRLARCALDSEAVQMARKYGKRLVGSLGTALLVGLSLSAAGHDVSLVAAVKTGNAAAARALLAKQVDVNVTEADGTTALHWAA